MKSTGIVRRLDSLGRIVIPKELRRTHGIEPDDPIEIFVEGDTIILRKYRPGCELCGSVDEVYRVGGHRICRICAEDISRAVTGRGNEA